MGIATRVAYKPWTCEIFTRMIKGMDLLVNNADLVLFLIP